MYAVNMRTATADAHARTELRLTPTSQVQTLEAGTGKGTKSAAPQRPRRQSAQAGEEARRALETKVGMISTKTRVMLLLKQCASR